MLKDMEEQELDDGSSESETVHETDEGNSDGDETQKQDKKKKSTSEKFKELHRKAKQAEALEKELQEAREELEQWRSENPEIVKGYLEKKEGTTLEKRVFLIENPEAKEHFEQVEARAKKYNMPLDEAWEDIKLRLPTESRSKTDFSFTGKNTPAQKDLKSMTADEALELSPEKRKEWRKVHGFYG